MNYTTAEEAVKIIKSDDTVFIHGAAQAPQLLIDAMCARSGELKNVRIVHIHHEGKAPYVEPKYEGIFRLESFFVGPERPTSGNRNGWGRPEGFGNR